MKQEKIILGIVDDHQIVIDGLMSLLKGHENFSFAFATTDPTSVLESVLKKRIDVLLTDIMMPELPGNELAKQIKKHFPDVKILALSMSGQGDLVSEMIEQADISGYVLKKHRQAGVNSCFRKNCRWRYLFQRRGDKRTPISRPKKKAKGRIAVNRKRN
ncbi:MAG: response regulator transcription factor [Chitinophagaceae bacterium]|nr:response regulator transcription factor [Chitinophagaceae bacterium]